MEGEMDGRRKGGREGGRETIISCSCQYNSLTNTSNTDTRYLIHTRSENLLFNTRSVCLCPHALSIQHSKILCKRQI